MYFPRLAIWLLFVLALVAAEAFAHARWDSSGLLQPRSNRDDIKVGPCGEPRGAEPVVLQAGASIEVKFEATVYHQGYFRIAFSRANDEGFDEHVLADNIQDFPGERFRTYSITLPDEPCDACTLQLIQVMLDRTPPSNYYSCADIQLVADGTIPRDTTPPEDIQDILAVANMGSVELMWTNPEAADFAGVLVVQADRALTTAPQMAETYKVNDALGEGRIVYKGTAEQLQLTNLSDGDTYMFKVFAFDAALNYAAGVSTEVTLPAHSENLAPSVELKLEQTQSDQQGVVTTDGGEVVVQALVTDPNNGDQHSFDWSEADARLHNVAIAPDQFRFDPSTLEAGPYNLIVDVSDDGNPPQTVRAELAITVQKPDSSTSGGAISFWSLLVFVLLAQQRKKIPTRRFL